MSGLGFRRVGFGVLLAASILPGCATPGSVRYVYQDGDYGVVGLPENSDRWPTHYRERAEQLMAQHFPRGYQVVRAEEVVEGSRTKTLGGTHSATLGGAEANPFLKIGTLGLTTSRSQAETTAITECRIVYKRADPVAPTLHKGDYAQQATLTPTQYLDPNALTRAQLEKAEKDARKDKDASKDTDKDKAKDDKKAEPPAPLFPGVLPILPPAVTAPEPLLDWKG